MLKKIISLWLCSMMLLFTLTGCGNKSTESSQTSSNDALTVNTINKIPKYIFLFMGDGMSHVQVNATQVYLGNNNSGEVATRNLNFTEFPVAGVATTHDSTSFCPDSASTATAVSCGIKTHSGVIGLEVDKTTKATSITEMLKANGKKIGIVSSVTINHATPAAFYAHEASRNEYYSIATQLAESDFDYFGGGTVSQPTGKEKDKQDVLEIIKEKGYKIANTKEEILALDSSSGKVYAQSPISQDSGALPYAIDANSEDLSLSDYVKKGINVLNNENGFFMMCESGKIDWACHANDAMAAIKEVIELEKSIQVAVDFAKEHPDETLIIVTGDHETGGMTIGYATTGYDTAFDILSKQKMSYVAFDDMIGDLKESNSNITFEKVMPLIKENFGLIVPDDADANVEGNKNFVLSEYEYKRLLAGFEESMKPEEERTQNQEKSVLYGGYDPLSVSITHIINNKAGIGWTSYSHTGTPVPVYAMGVGAEVFGGSYDNTDIFKKLVELCGL